MVLSRTDLEVRLEGAADYCHDRMTENGMHSSSQCAKLANSHAADMIAAAPGTRSGSGIPRKLGDDGSDVVRPLPQDRVVLANLNTLGFSSRCPARSGVDWRGREWQHELQSSCESEIWPREATRHEVKGGLTPQSASVKPAQAGCTHNHGQW